jgi:MarR family transcriptional regulator for hemolysin
MRTSLLQRFTWTLVHAGRTWRRAADQVVRAHDLSEATALPLVFIGRLGGEPRQNALAEAIGIEGPTLVRLLDQLCSANLVVRQEDPTDRRAKILRLTETGAAVVAAIETEFAALRERVFAGVSDDDIRASLRVFSALRESTGAGRAPNALADLPLAALSPVAPAAVEAAP